MIDACLPGLFIFLASGEREGLRGAGAGSAGVAVALLEVEPARRARSSPSSSLASVDSLSHTFSVTAQDKHKQQHEQELSVPLITPSSNLSQTPSSHTDARAAITAEKTARKKMGGSILILDRNCRVRATILRKCKQLPPTAISGAFICTNDNESHVNQAPDVLMDETAP